MDIEVLNVEVNLLAILISGVVSMVIGFVYYHPQVFGNTWMKLVGLTEKEIAKGVGMTYGLTFAVAMVQAFVVAIVVPYVGAMNSYEKVPAGLVGGFLLFVVVACASLTNTLFDHKRKKLWAIQSGYSLVYLLAAGLIVALV